jgi:hypothetical protein
VGGVDVWGNVQSDAEWTRHLVLQDAPDYESDTRDIVSLNRSVNSHPSFGGAGVGMSFMLVDQTGDVLSGVQIPTDFRLENYSLAQFGLGIFWPATSYDFAATITSLEKR